MIPEVPKIERQNSPELNSNQSIHNNGVPAMVVYLLAAFLMVVFLAVFVSVWNLGQLNAKVSALTSEVAGHRKDKAIAALEETRRTEDQLYADLAERDATILLLKSKGK